MIPAIATAGAFLALILLDGQDIPTPPLSTIARPGYWFPPLFIAGICGGLAAAVLGGMG